MSDNGTFCPTDGGDHGTDARLELVTVQVDHGHADVGYLSVDIDDGVITHLDALTIDDVPLAAEHPHQPAHHQPAHHQQNSAHHETPRAQPAPVDLNQHPALAAIDAQGTQNTLDGLSQGVHELEGQVGMPNGVPTLESALGRVQAPGGGLQTTTGLPLVTLGPGTPEGDRLSAALGPFARGGPLHGLLADENGVLRPSLGSLGPIVAAQRGIDVDPTIAGRVIDSLGGT